VVRLNAKREIGRKQAKKNLQALRFGILEAALVPSIEDSNELTSTREVGQWEVLPYGTVTEKELPQCNGIIPRLKGKTWWLTKQTWTFQPEEMRDLEFQPAIPVLAEKLDDKDGYFAAANLVPLGSNAVPVLLTALDGTNPTAQFNAASVLEQLNDPRVVGQLDKLLKDSQPDVRAHAIYLAMNHWNPKFTETYIDLLRDPYREIRHEAALILTSHHDDLSQYIPVFRQMLKDTNAGVRVSGMKMLWHLQVPIPREELLQLFKLPDREAISLALSQLRNGNNENISDAEAISLLQNPDIIARMIGLKILYQNAEKQSVELALPLLKDPQPLVRRRTAATLRALTGQHFTDEQPDQWEKWWDENKATFVVELHPEELRPQRRGTNDLRWYLTNRPPATAENPPR
jgi:HEAT repeat protein